VIMCAVAAAGILCLNQQNQLSKITRNKKCNVRYFTPQRRRGHEGTSEGRIEKCNVKKPYITLQGKDWVEHILLQLNNLYEVKFGVHYS